MSSLGECHVWDTVVTKLLSCRCSEAHAILFLFLVFDLCLSSARRIFMLLTLAGLCSFVLVKGRCWIWGWLAVRGVCPFPRCPGVPVSTLCPLDQLLGCIQCCSCQGRQSCTLELQQWKGAQAVLGSSGHFGPCGKHGQG